MNRSTLPEPQIKDSPALLLAGLRESLDQNAAQNIPLLWQKLAPHIGKTPQQVGHNCYGVCAASYANLNIFYYMAAMEVASLSGLPEAFSSIHLPAQRYAVFTHAHHVSRIRETIDAVFDQWLPRAQVVHANQVLHFFERYTADYSPTTGLGGTEIWLPIS